MPPRKEDPLNEPERAGRHHDDRSGDGELPSRGFVPRAQRRKCRGHDGHDQKLTDFHSDVERKKGDQPSARAGRIHLAQHVREPEPVN